MVTIFLALAAELGLVAGVSAWRVRARGSAARQWRRFEMAATEERRLAHHARIVDARLAELSELVIERSLADLGVELAIDP